MGIQVFDYNDLGEKLHFYEHKSGLKTFIIPKKDYSKKYAAIGTHFGSINNSFQPPGENEIINVPDGVAHFLEHKLFQQEDGDVMEKFASLGASPNAYTGFNQTVYHFLCSERFNENFNLLLDFVQNPYITEESVEKEKGIIGQEIKMYEDDPNWRVFFNLLGSMYQKHPVRIDIAGTIESIAKIDKKVLMKCYNTFYHPSNMVLIVVGDVNPQSVVEKVCEKIKTDEHKDEIKRFFPEEDESLNNKYSSQELAVSKPLFMVGFKDFIENIEKNERVEREITIKILLDMIMGKSSELYNEMYNEGLINDSFQFDYTIEENYAFSDFGGESHNPMLVMEKVIDEVEKIMDNDIDYNHLERIIKASKGRFIRYLNSIERTSQMFIPAYFKGNILFDYMKVYDKISFKYAKETFNNHFDVNNLSISIINPLKGG